MVIVVIGLIAISLFYAQKYLYKNWWNKEVFVSLKFQDDTVRAGEQTSLSEVVENHKWLPLPALKVKFQCSSDILFVADKSSQVSDMYYRNDLFSLMPFRRITRTHKIICSHRGYYGIRGIDLVGADLFLSQEMVESRAGETWIHVIPALEQVPELDAAIQMINGEIAHRRHLLTDPFAFRGIREYTPFDEVKTVNWKASAKSDDLKVNVHDYSATSSMSIFINVRDRELSAFADQIEKAIGIGAYLADIYLANGVNVSIYANGRDILSGNIICAEGYNDRKQLEQIHKMLARIDLSREVEPFENFEERMKIKSGRMIVVISPDWLEELQDLLCRLDGQQDFIWLCPCRKEADVKIREELREQTLLIPDKI